MNKIPAFFINLKKSTVDLKLVGVGVNVSIQIN